MIRYIKVLLVLIIVWLISLTGVSIMMTRDIVKIAESAYWNRVESRLALQVIKESMDETSFLELFNAAVAKLHRVNTTSQE